MTLEDGADPIEVLHELQVRVAISNALVERELLSAQLGLDGARLVTLQLRLLRRLADLTLDMARVGQSG